VFTRPGGYHVAKPLALALEAHNGPGVRARLLNTLNAISALPEVDMLSEPEAADNSVDLAKVCPSSNATAKDVIYHIGRPWSAYTHCPCAIP
jgi:hypothetical protein